MRPQLRAIRLPCRPATAACCAVALAALLLGLGGCGYPEAGYYELVLYAPEGQPAPAAADAAAGPAVEARLPFMVEELTDDTDLTIGFVLLLPQGGALVRIPLRNSADTSRRGWSLAIADADSGAGDLELAIEHYGERLSIRGRFRADATAPVQALQGAMAEAGLLLLEPPLEARAGGERRRCAMAEVRRLTLAEFEAALGAKLKAAPRREAQALAPLPAAPAEAGPAPGEKKSKRPRPLGGRGGGGR